MPLSMQVTVEAVDTIDHGAGRQQRAAARARPYRGNRSGSARRCRARRRCAHRLRTRPGRPASRSRATATLRVLTMWMRTGVTGSGAGTSPFSIANGPIPASRLPQFWLSLTSASSTDDLQEQVVDVGVGTRRRRRPPRPCWSADARRPSRRSGADPASPSPRAAPDRASRDRRAGRGAESRGPSTCRRA